MSNALSQAEAKQAALELIRDQLEALNQIRSELTGASDLITPQTADAKNAFREAQTAIWTALDAFKKARKEIECDAR